MSLRSVKDCPCGSGKPSQWVDDGNGIPLCRVCDDCEETKLSRFNPRILSSYTEVDVDERIDAD